jgi:methionine sulfoxide reductase heme-binding subunit
MARSPVGRWTDRKLATDTYQSAPYGAPDTYQPGPYPDTHTHQPTPYAGQDTYEPARYPDAAIDTRRGKEKPANDSPPQQRAAKSRLDEWMDADFKFGGSRIKRKAVALILLGVPAVVPLFFMLPALFTLNSNTMSVSGDDTLGTGAEFCLFVCLLVTPLVTLTGQRWFVPLRKWYGILVACCAIADAVFAGTTDTFAGGVFGRLAGHVFELMGFMMVMILIPLLLISNNRAQRWLGRYWRPLQRLTYAVWGLLALHLILLEGFGFQRGDNGSGFPGDGDPIFHQRLYQYGSCSLFLLVLRLPPVKRWIAARQKEGRNWLVWVTIAPIFALFVFAMIFIINEEIFKGLDSFKETPSAE